MHGYDKKGQAIIVLTIRNHTPGEYPMEDMVKFALVVIQTAVRKSEKYGNTPLTAVGMGKCGSL